MSSDRGFREEIKAVEEILGEKEKFTKFLYLFASSFANCFSKSLDILNPLFFFLLFCDTCNIIEV